MIKAIVYTSNSGFTKKYAEILGNEIKIPVYDLKDAKINKDDEILYMGWIMAGKIQKYNKASEKYNIKAVCAVGMSRSNEKQKNEIIQKSNIKTPFFYLQGGFDMNKLSGIYKFMMKTLQKIVQPKIEAKANKTEEEIEMLDMMKNGKDCVKKENLNEIINWIKNENV